jgi:predicted HTH domain antitoxin
MATSRLTQSSNQEGKILLAIQAYKKGQISSLNKASALYSVPFSTLWYRIHGRTTRENAQSLN